MRLTTLAGTGCIDTDRLRSPTVVWDPAIIEPVGMGVRNGEIGKWAPEMSVALLIGTEDNSEAGGSEPSGMPA